MTLNEFLPKYVQFKVVFQSPVFLYVFCLLKYAFLKQNGFERSFISNVSAVGNKGPRTVLMKDCP